MRMKNFPSPISLLSLLLLFILQMQPSCAFAFLAAPRSNRCGHRLLLPTTRLETFASWKSSSRLGLPLDHVGPSSSASLPRRRPMALNMGLPSIYALKPGWWGYIIQNLAVSSWYSQIFLVTIVSFIFVTLGAISYMVVMPNAVSKGLAHWLFRSYLFLNKVTGHNPMHADSRREKIMNNILQNLNTISISIVTGLVAASSKTAFDGVVNGNFPIFERGHVVLLMDDWCEQVPPIIGHFDAIASQGVLPRLMQDPIVVLSNLPKARTTALIEAGRGKEKRQVQVIVRQGDPRKAPDLERVCTAEASKVVLLTGDTDRASESPDGAPSGKLVNKIRTDAALLKAFRSKAAANGGPKALLALPGSGRHWQEYETEFTICEDQEFAGRLLAMCTVEGSGGLSKVFNAILKPGSSSFQIVPAPDTLVGTTFKDLQGYYPRCCLVGLVKPGDEVVLAPKPGRKLKEGESIIAFGNSASDVQYKKVWGDGPADGRDGDVDIDIAYGPKSEVNRGASKRRVLMLGWNERGQETLKEIADVLPPGSRISMLQKAPRAIDKGQLRVEVEQHIGDRSDIKMLSRAGADSADVIVCLSDSLGASNTDDITDSELLAVIQSLGKVKQAPGGKVPRLVAMVHSPKTRQLIEEAAKEAGIFADLILANDLESGALVQVLMNPDLESVFNAVLDANGGNGKELLSLQASKVFRLEGDSDRVVVTFRQLRELVGGKGHVALGVMISKPGGEVEVLLNPQANKKLVLGPSDGIVAIGTFEAAQAPVV